MIAKNLHIQNHLYSLIRLIVFGRDFNNLLQIRLIEVLPRIVEYILRLFLQNLEQKNRHHILQLRMFPQISLIIDSILNFLLIEQFVLSSGQVLNSNDVVRVVVLVLVIDVVHLVVVEILAIFVVFFLGLQALLLLFGEFGHLVGADF